jgi:pimeloyl-ACP methyl ester carboxylesterase
MDEELLDRLFAGQMKDDEEFRRAYGMILPLYNVNYDPEDGARRLAAVPFRYETHNWAFSKNQPNFDLVSRLGEIKVPTLVTVGRHDWVTPLEASEEIAAKVPNAELVIFENSGHSPQVEEHERFISVVRDFLDRHVPV